MRQSSLTVYRRTTVAALVLLIFGLLVGLPGRAAARQSDPVIGPVVTLALDAAGNGWGFASPLVAGSSGDWLRIENGAWRIYTGHAVPPHAYITRIALTTAGTDGWAIGSAGGDNGKTLLLRWQRGAWVDEFDQLPLQSLKAQVDFLSGVTLSADGSEGWLVAGLDDDNATFVLFHLSRGRWQLVAQPEGDTIFDVGISPDGKSGWASGLSLRVDSSNPAFQLEHGQWQPTASDAIPSTHVVDAITAQDSGDGWFLSNHFRAIAASVLTYLHPGAAPLEAPIKLPYPGMGDYPLMLLGALAVDNYGRGWAIGAVTGEVDQVTVRPVLLRISGKAATFMTPAGLDLSDEQAINANLLATNSAGTHIWLAWAGADNHGHLLELHQYWDHAGPAAAAPLAGSGQCFSEVQYCLRGVFADFWNAHGGLQQFGFPVTPEVQEQIGGKSYTVQYTQRARLEWHPEYKGTANEVLLGLLGNTLVNSRLQEAPFRPAQKVTSFDVRWFAETQHNVSVPILPYWQGHGAIPVFGLPRSEAFQETNAADGKQYLVQYFERNRIEYHPENRGTAFEFQLGLLGVEQFNKTYGYMP